VEVDVVVIEPEEAGMFGDDPSPSVVGGRALGRVRGTRDAA
jgi:hypothetical protein